MGGFYSTENSEHGGWLPGKIKASLNEKLRTVKWGEYELGKLFDIENTLSFNADKLIEGTEYDYVTRTSINQGILQTTGYVNSENINPAGTWSLGLLSMDFFYRNKPWYAGQFVRKITPKIDIPLKAILFFSTILNNQKTALLSVLVRNVDSTFKKLKVKLPITTTREIDFDFMESFISDLEAERLSTLSDFLQARGLDHCELTAEEINAIDKLRTVQWHEYKLGDLFAKIETKKLPYQAKELPDVPTDKYVLPCLTSSFQNQGLNYYAPKDGATVLKNVVSIPSNSDVYRAYFQSREFTVLSDAYAIKWKYGNRELTPNQYLFVVMCINKITDLSIYSHKNKLGGWNKVKDKWINLPQKNGEIDFEYMETLISAMQKLVIKDVAFYVKQKA